MVVVGKRVGVSWDMWMIEVRCYVWVHVHKSIVIIIVFIIIVVVIITTTTTTTTTIIMIIVMACFRTLTEV